MNSGRPSPAGRSVSREIIWRRVLDDLSLELARFSWTGLQPQITGSVLIAEQGAPLRVDYRITCDGAWYTREVQVETVWRGARRTLRLERDGRGHWRRDGEDAPDLADCTDVDLEVTPATNALPVNRLRLPVGARQEILAAWVRFPSLRVIPARQSYERVGESRYRYMSLDSGFTALVDVDEHGFPAEYEGIWRRIAEGPG